MQLNRKPSDRPSKEEAFAEAEASVRLEGMDPSGPLYDELKARVIAGEITVDQAIETLKAQDAGREPAQILRSPNGLAMFPPTGKILTLEMVKTAEEEMDLEDARKTEREATLGSHPDGLVF